MNVILFDGVCNMCNTAVNFVIDHDSKAVFKFASLQSEQGKAIGRQYGIDTTQLESVVLIKDGKAYAKSDAALQIARQFDGLWSWLYAFVIVPRFIRDSLYKWVANNRYKWFGKRESCRMPTKELKARFL
jgi:predicted DCC family thiol-disulfide oxidoreductase YuxK